MLTDYNEYLEGVKIWYNGTTLNWRNATDEEITILNPRSDSILCSNGSLMNVDNSGSSSYSLTGLMAFTQYDIFLMPFYKMLLGKPSNLMSGYTDEDGEKLYTSLFVHIVAFRFTQFFFVCLFIYNMVRYFMALCFFSTLSAAPERDGWCNKCNLSVDTLGTTTCKHVEWRTYWIFGEYYFTYAIVL